MAILNAPMQAKPLDLCTLRFLFCLNQKDEIGILNLMYYESPSLLLLNFFSQSNLQSLFYMYFQFLLPFFMSMHMDKAKCVLRATYTIQ